MNLNLYRNWHHLANAILLRIKINFLISFPLIEVSTSRTKLQIHSIDTSYNEPLQYLVIVVRCFPKSRSLEM